MPELPEVETTIRDLRPHLDGQRLVAVAVRRADLRRPFPADLRQRLTGARVTGLSRRAKYGLIATDRELTMVFHLGMSGRWVIDADTLDPHDHLVLTTEGGTQMALRDPRRFGSVDLVATGDLDAWPAFVALGPEPLGDALDAGLLLRAFRGRAAPLKALLLDQRIVAGLGNIYVCEALNLARLSPMRSGGSVTRAGAARLSVAIKQVLIAAIGAGGSTITAYFRPDGIAGDFARNWRVYDREGAPCPCGRGTIVRTVQSGRSTWYCPRCQR